MYEFKIDVMLDVLLFFVFVVFYEFEYFSEWFVLGDCLVI